MMGIPLRLLPSLGALLLMSAPAAASEVACKDADLPCALQVSSVYVDAAPALFRFQARLSRAKLPLGDATFASVEARLMRGDTTLCAQTFADVSTRDSTLTLVIGPGMDCPFQTIVAETAGRLGLKVCVDGQCLKPVELDAVPYALKANIAYQSNLVRETDEALTANYARRLSADRGQLANHWVQVGWFDGSTAAASDVHALYTAADFPPYFDSGFLSWTPVRNPTARRLHIVGRNVAADTLEWLDELVLGANEVHARGSLEVATTATVDSALDVARDVTLGTQAAHTVTASGAVDVAGMLHIFGETTFETILDVVASTLFELGSPVHVRDDLTVTGPLAFDNHVTLGDAPADSTTARGALTIDESLTVTGDVDFGNAGAGALTMTDLTAANTLELATGADIHAELDLSPASGLRLLVQEDKGELDVGAATWLRVGASGALIGGSMKTRIDSIAPGGAGAVHVHKHGRTGVITSFPRGDYGTPPDHAALVADAGTEGFVLASGESSCVFATTQTVNLSGSPIYLVGADPKPVIHLVVDSTNPIAATVRSLSVTGPTSGISVLQSFTVEMSAIGCARVYWTISHAWGEP